MHLIKQAFYYCSFMFMFISFLHVYGLRLQVILVQDCNGTTTQYADARKFSAQCRALGRYICM